MLVHNELLNIQWQNTIILLIYDLDNKTKPANDNDDKL